MEKVYNGFWSAADDSGEEENRDRVYTQEESLQPSRSTESEDMNDITNEEGLVASTVEDSGPLSSVLTYLGGRYEQTKADYVPTAVAPRLTLVESMLKDLSTRAHLGEYVRTVDVRIETSVMRPATDYYRVQFRPAVDDKVAATRSMLESKATEYYAVGRKSIDGQVDKVKAAAAEKVAVAKESAMGAVTAAQDRIKATYVVKSALPVFEKAREVVRTAAAPLDDEDQEEVAATDITLVAKSARVTNRLRRRAMAKLSQYQLTERAEKLHHISLIDYAKHNMDTGMAYTWDLVDRRVIAPTKNLYTTTTESATNKAADSRAKLEAAIARARAAAGERAHTARVYYSEKAGTLFSTTAVNMKDAIYTRAQGMFTRAQDVSVDYYSRTKTVVYEYASGLTDRAHLSERMTSAKEAARLRAAAVVEHTRAYLPSAPAFLEPYVAYLQTPEAEERYQALASSASAAATAAYSSLRSGLHWATGPSTVGEKTAPVAPQAA